MEVNIEISEKQWIALSYLRDDITNEILFWGWARGWKSILWCIWIISECVDCPWACFMIWRNELKRLKATTLLTFFEVLKMFKINQKAYNYNAQDSIITFANSAKVFLADLSYMPSDPNYDRLWSYWLTWIFIDEAQEIDYKAINILKWRLSLLTSPVPDIKEWNTNPKMLYTCNPSKGWIYQEFYLPYKELRLAKNKQFIPSLVTDNPYVWQAYIDFLATADKITVERLLRGNFDYDDTPWKLYSFDDLNALFTNPIYNWLKCITCDVARFWKDRAVIMVWDWFEVIDFKVFDICTTTELIDQITQFKNIYNINQNSIIADEDWIGWGIVDWLQCRWFVNNSNPVDTRTDQQIYQNAPKPNYENLKTQCYFTLQQYIKSINLSRLSQYKQEIIQELDVMSERNLDKDWKKQIIRKEDIKKAIGRSPDFADCIVFRIYFTLLMQSEVIETPEITESDMYIHEMLNDSNKWHLQWILD